MYATASISASLLEPVLTAAAMRSADRYTIESYGISGSTLMEVAGRAVFSAMESRFGSMHGRRVTVLCGRGNNGGDGFVAARILYSAGASVRVVTVADPEDHTADAAQYLRVLHRLKDHDNDGRLEILRLDAPDLLGSLASDELCVDALLGTGLTREIREPVRAFVEWMNAQNAPVVAVDMPTGLHSDLGTMPGAAVRADITVTMGAYKAGLLLEDGPGRAGEVVVAEIGIPAHALLAEAQASGCAFLTTDRAVRSLLPTRTNKAHKYSVGLTLVIGGSPGLSGAPVMASTAAARVGAGAVVCACHFGVQPILASMLTEVMTLSLPGTDTNGLDPKGATDALAARLQQARSVLIGCGLGRLPGTSEFVRHFCTQTELPLVIDADGLWALSGYESLIQKHSKGRWVLTPHDGEFKRLANGADLQDRIEGARYWSNRWNVVLLLKGMPSIVGTPHGRVYICRTGNPALATAGTGDVLAGLCAGLLAQGLSPEQAAVCAIHLGGAAADTYIQEKSARTMMATDLLSALTQTLHNRYETSQ